jgi:RimJ/RimL family protein N-acetyltransferase
LDQITLRPLHRDDFSQLVEWINKPHVVPWWDGEADLDSVVAEFQPALINDSPTKVFVVQIGNESVGFAQCYRHKDYSQWDRSIGIPEAAGIDFLIGESGFLGKGIGAKVILAITNVAFALYSDVNVVVSAPQRDNRSSCRALENAGFDCLGERKLDSDCPSDSGISCIYACQRARGSNAACLESQ